MFAKFGHAGADCRSWTHDFHWLQENGFQDLILPSEDQTQPSLHYIHHHSLNPDILVHKTLLLHTTSLVKCYLQVKAKKPPPHVYYVFSNWILWIRNYRGVNCFIKRMETTWPLFILTLWLWRVSLSFSFHNLFPWEYKYDLISWYMITESHNHFWLENT